MKKLFLYALILSLNFLGLSSQAQANKGRSPDYKTELLARANGPNTYNLPTNSYIFNSSPSINPRGDVTFKVSYVLLAEDNSKDAVWAKTHDEPNGKIVYVNPTDKFISDPKITPSEILFNISDEFSTNGIFSYNLKLKTTSSLFSPNVEQNLINTSDAQVTSDGILHFKGQKDNREKTYYSLSGKNLIPIISEGSTLFAGEKPISYLFSLHSNSSETLIFKTRQGDFGDLSESAPDKIIALNTIPYRGVFKIIAEDQDSNINSSFLSLGNSASISSNGKCIVFSARVLNDKKQPLDTIMLYKNNEYTVIANNTFREISEIESFSPKVNSSCNVAFRAKDHNGRRSIFLFKDHKLQRIIGENDQITTDLGEAYILEKAGYPGLSGNIDMNDANEIVFSALISSDNTHTRSLGTGVFKLHPL
ncbi:MAG: hypothetical protein ACK41T_03775 [Pseudobdellovibrio sp.]